MDKLKELSVKLDGRIKQQQLISPNLGETSFKELIVKNYRGYRVGIDEYKSLYSIGIKINCDMSFSINKEDVVFSYYTPKHLSDLPYKIYVSDEAYNLVKDDSEEKFWGSFIPLLNKIGLSEYE